MASCSHTPATAACRPRPAQLNGLFPPSPSRGVPRSAWATRGPRAGRLVAAGAGKSVLVPVGNGVEEMEAVITIDVLRRAGAEVTVASVEDDVKVTCSRGVQLVADANIAECATTEYDLIALPGGMPGAERLRDSEVLAKLLGEQASRKGLYAAICASPAVVFQSQNLLNGRKATSHPAFVDRLADQSSAASRVVVDGNLTTSRGPGTAFEFALSLVQQLFGEEKMKEVAGPMVMYDYTH
ncbi:unnamed protein product [Ostreobium quekettii]|uniref:DJ-1/PfpI domain-containing protein n=1 Tax=Ostreobium quekettii TaxID=121088 RepID=A0A8S1JBZ3_9CHLO|nr:unnamed protein product [Ostreobium quekettii]|eukprot:evm.model.scf_58.16 EVM.evm.TU.scf_58.16   scf_58:142424-146282(-)